MCCRFSAWAGSYTGVSFFVIAHEDDWQLFMGKHAKDMVELKGRKLVFIYLTAGDAGAGKNARDNGKIPYYMARENAAVKSTDLLCRHVTDSTQDDAAAIRVNGHLLTVRWRKNTVSYYLRLPDGGMRAEGRVALKQLYQHKIPALSSVDSSTTYNSWEELVGTVRGIMKKETGDLSRNIEVNMPDVCSKRNPGDHADHYLAGVVAISATKNLCYDNFLYTGYNVSKCPQQITEQDADFKLSLLRCIGVELKQDGYADCQDNWHKSFTQNEYSMAEPNACNYPDSDVFYIRRFDVRAEDDDRPADKYSCIVYPNPAQSVLHIAVTDHERSITDVRVLDIYGNTQQNIRISDVGYAWEKELDISDINAGVYFIEVLSGGVKTLQRFVKY